MSVDKMTFRDIDGKKPEKEITVTCLEFPLAEDEKGEYQSSKIKWIDSLICKEGSSPIFNDKFREGLSFHLVRSVSEFVDTLPKTTPLDSSSSYCFRGQSATSLILPSILRNPAYYTHMQSMQDEVLSAYPQEFKDIEHSFDKLALMRSKGLPANILDCTTNPLVALYHACKACIGDNKTIGMVLFYKAAVLHHVNEVERGPNSFPLFIRPSYIDAQMANQQTIFLLFQNKTFRTMVDKACLFNQTFLEKSIFLIHKKSAEIILEELDELGIGDYQMDPEIENLTESVKKKFSGRAGKDFSIPIDGNRKKIHLETLAMAYIDRGYVSVSCHTKHGNSESWFLSDTDSLCLEDAKKKRGKIHEENREEEIFNTDCKGTIKLIQVCKKSSNSVFKNSLKELKTQLEYSIKVRLAKRLEELDNRRFFLLSMKGEQEKQRQYLENDKTVLSSECNNLGIGENYRWGSEIKRILMQIQSEKDFLNTLKTHLIIQEFYPNGSSTVTKNWLTLLFYDPQRIKPIAIGSAADLLQEIDFFKKGKECILKPYSLYYRGQPLQFPVEASLFRDMNYIKHEKDMYAELLARLPETFNKEPSIFDRLVVMKHYNFPSRLLDLTSNPLVALLFAILNMTNLENPSLALQAVNICFSKKEDEKDILSDTVVRLCALPLVEDYELSDDGSDENDFLNEIKYRSQRYAPGYYPMQPCMEELEKAIVVHPSMNNKRVERQKGEFILSGRNNEDPKHQNGDVNNYFFPRELSFLFPIPLFIVSGKNLEVIATELKQHFGLDKSSIYPEMKYKIGEIKKALF